MIISGFAAFVVWAWHDIDVQKHKENIAAIQRAEQRRKEGCHPVQRKNADGTISIVDDCPFRDAATSTLPSTPKKATNGSKESKQFVDKCKQRHINADICNFVSDPLKYGGKPMKLYP